MKSPDSIEPTASSHDKQETLAALQKIEKDMAEVIATHDLELICEAAEMPGFGMLTIYEWADFAMTHTQRHTRQLEKIHQSLRDK